MKYHCAAFILFDLVLMCQVVASCLWPVDMGEGCMCLWPIDMGEGCMCLWPVDMGEGCMCL